MPTKRKSKTMGSSRSMTTTAGSSVGAGLDKRDQIILIIACVVVFLFGLLFTDQMSRAVAAVVVSGWERQVSIGSVQFNSTSRVIATSVATGVFERPSGDNVYDVRASLNIPVANVLSYQLFTASSSDPSSLTDMNVYGCLQQLSTQDLNRNVIFVGCTATPSSPRIPSVGDKILARYYYIPGTAIYNGPLCGNGKVETGEICDDGSLNGHYGHCNNTCNGRVAGSCPTGFSGPSLIPGGGTDACASDWSTTGELSCLTKCTPTIQQYPNNNYKCYIMGDSKYRCFGQSLNTGITQVPPTTNTTPVKKAPAEVPAQ